MARIPISPTLRFKIFVRDDFQCVYCGATPDQVELRVDHVHPVAAGGTNDPDNLVTACHDCNAGKGARLIPRRLGPDTTEKLIEELRIYGDIEREAQERRAAWIAGLHIPDGAAVTLRWLSGYADCTNGVTEDLPWTSPRLMEVLRGLQAVGLISPAPETSGVYSLSPRGSMRLHLEFRLRGAQLDEISVDSRCWKLEEWYWPPSFPTVESIHG